MEDSTKYLVTPEIQDLLDRLDAFIEAKIKPLQASDDNERFFDHRREYARTDWENGGLPRKSGMAYCTRCAHWPTKRASGACLCPRSSAGKSAAT
jgi:hypothetical protein